MDGVQGMFGQDPALIQQAIQQQRQQEYNAAANTPQGRGIVSLGSQAGGMLGDALGAATGVQDPRVAEAQLGQQVQQKVIEQAKMQGIDPVADPESFIKLVAQGWMDAGKPDKAYAAVNTLQQLQAQKSKMGLESAKTQAELRKSSAESSPFAKVDASKFEPQSLAAFAKTGDYSQLQPVDRNNKVVTTAEGVFMVNNAGQPVARIGAPFASTNISVGGKEESAFATEKGKLDAKKLMDIQESATVATDTLGRLGRMGELATSGIYSGTLAQKRTDVANFLNTIGIPVGAELANSQEFIALTRQSVLDQIKALGSGTAISDTDRKFVEQMVPQLEHSPGARTALLNFMAQKAKKAVNTAKMASRYAESQGSLSGFTPGADWVIKTPEEVRELYASKRISKEEATMLLKDMESQGKF